MYVPAAVPAWVCAAGPLSIDKEVYSQLLATGQFEQMNLDVDEVRDGGRETEGEGQRYLQKSVVAAQPATPSALCPSLAQSATTLLLTPAACRAGRFLFAGRTQPGAAHTVHCQDHGVGCHWTFSPSLFFQYGRGLGVHVWQMQANSTDRGVNVAGRRQHVRFRHVGTLYKW